VKTLSLQRSVSPGSAHLGKVPLNDTTAVRLKLIMLFRTISCLLSTCVPLLSQYNVSSLIVCFFRERLGYKQSCAMLARAGQIYMKVLLD
jgi:hypothetical protein